MGPPRGGVKKCNNCATESNTPGPQPSSYSAIPGIGSAELIFFAVSIWRLFRS